MLAVARQSYPRGLNPAAQGDAAQSDAEWVTVKQAAEISAEPERTWSWRAQSEAAAAAKAGRRALAHKAPAPGSTRLVWYVHRSCSPALSRTPTTDTRAEKARPSLLTRYPQHQVELAYRKNHWLQEWLKGERRPGDSDRQHAERIIRQAKEQDGTAFAISFRTLQAWRTAYFRSGPDGQIVGVEGLVDRRSVAQLASEEGAAQGRRDPVAVDYFYSLYHTESQQSVRVCHEVTRAVAAREGWQWPASYAATTAWLRQHDNLSLTCLMREGKDTWCRRFMPHLEIDYSLVAPGALYQADHHSCDYWVELDGKQLRPWLTAVQDCRSRAIVGWHLGPSPHQDAILSAYLMAFKDWGIPEKLRIDNGKDFASELLTGVTKGQRDALRRAHGPEWRKVLERDAHLVECGVDKRFAGITAELGVELIYAIPYAPWSKGTTERWFGTFEGRCGKTFATYCGNSAFNRPECLEAIRRGYTKEQKRYLRKKHGKDWKREVVLRFVDQSAVPTLEQARALVGQYIEEYNATPHGAEDMAGMTPLECWRTAKSLRRADEEALLFMMQARGLYKVGANGVKFKVGGVTMGYGNANPALCRYAGRDVFITLDPNDLSHVHAFTEDRKRYLGRLEANERISPLETVDNLREANASVNHRRKVAKMHEAQRRAAGRTRTAVAELQAQGRAKAAARRSTGTDGRCSADAVVVPVRTGFETSARDARRLSTPQPEPPSEYDRLTLADIAAAASYYEEEEERRLQEELQREEEQARRPRVDLLTLGRFAANYDPDEEGDRNFSDEVEDLFAEPEP